MDSERAESEALVREHVRASDVSLIARTNANRKVSCLACAAWIVLAYTGFVILFGALVRITGSGAGCGQHWPTCHGEIVHLPRTLETAIEFTHRVTSGFALFAAFGLWWLVARQLPKGHRARAAAAASAGLMVVEALIGAGLVLLALVGQNTSAARAVVMPAHLLSTYALTAALCLTALWVSPHSRPASQPRSAGRLLAVFGAVALVLVSATGAVTALGDTVYPPAAGDVAARLSDDHGTGAHFLQRLRIVHPVLAVTFALFLLGTAPRLAGYAESRRGALAGRTLMALLVVQLGAGLVNVWLSAPGYLQVIHLALAVAVWLAFVVLVNEALFEANAPRAQAAKG
jgi:cytochrome c oxidase assembly protein subunit 15